MFALANVIHLLLDELTRLSAGSLTLALIALSTLQRLFLWHAHLLHHSYRDEKIEQPASLAIAGSRISTSAVSYFDTTFDAYVVSPTGEAPEVLSVMGCVLLAATSTNCKVTVAGAEPVFAACP